MQKILGSLIIVACVLGGYALANGELAMLWQPAEMLIIVGAALGSLVVGNPKEVLIEMAKQAKGVVVYKRPRQYRATYYARSDSSAGTFDALSQLVGLSAGGPKFLFLWAP